MLQETLLLLSGIPALGLLWAPKGGLPEFAEPFPPRLHPSLREDEEEEEEEFEEDEEEEELEELEEEEEEEEWEDEEDEEDEE